MNQTTLTTIDKQLEALKATRKNLLKVLEESSPAVLITIPERFNNNILWNILHVMASQQLLIYGLSKTPFRLDKDFVFQFKSGTRPNGENDLAWVDLAKNNLLSLVEYLSTDYEAAIFGEGFKTVKLSYGIEIATVEDAINFNNIHEAMHYGQIKTLQSILS